MPEVAGLFLVAGAAFCALAGLGLVRARDTLSRLHVVGLASTFGAGGALVGSLFHHGAGWEEVGIAGFLVLSVPAGSHALARALARRSGSVPGWPFSGDS